MKAFSARLIFSISRSACVTTLINDIYRISFCKSSGTTRKVLTKRWNTHSPYNTHAAQLSTLNGSALSYSLLCRSVFFLFLPSVRVMNFLICRAHSRIPAAVLQYLPTSTKGSLNYVYCEKQTSGHDSFLCTENKKTHHHICFSEPGILLTISGYYRKTTLHSLTWHMILINKMLNLVPRP